VAYFRAVKIIQAVFSKSCEYGIRAMTFIAKKSQEGKRVSLKEISDEIDSPTAFTAKVLQLLVKHQLLESTKGPTGGFVLSTTDSKSITLAKIVYAIDGDQVYKGCGLGLKQCSEKQPCPVHDEFKKVRNELKKMLESTTIEYLANRLDQKNVTLKR